MTQDEIIEMAKQVGSFDAHRLFYFTPLRLELFAKLVAQHEREACAKLFDDRNTGTGFYDPHEPAEIIRARGQA
jgi:hypothetical protein